jgi:glycosyltransferase involved in cell wall biosynthesis
MLEADLKHPDSIDAPLQADVAQQRPLLLIFDETITRNSPAGSCVLRLVEAVAGPFNLHLFVNRTDAHDHPAIRKTFVPLPNKPVLLRYVLFSLFSLVAYVARSPRLQGFIISTQGAFPFCDLCYAHFCHKEYLRRHWKGIGGGFLRRTARLLSHLFAAATEAIAFRSARLVVVPSQGLARELSHAYPGPVNGKIRVIANPVDTTAFVRPADFSASVFRAKLQIPSEAFLFCFCALGDFERKGLKLILEALAAGSASPVQLMVVGGSPGEIRSYAALAERLKLGSRVHFAGFQKDIRRYLWASDAFVFPSSYEVSPLVCLQAAAAGLPLLVTPLYGVEEFIRGGAGGWIVERSVSSIESAMSKAARDKPLAERLGREAQERVQVFGLANFQARWLELLRTAPL